MQAVRHTLSRCAKWHVCDHTCVLDIITGGELIEGHDRVLQAKLPDKGIQHIRPLTQLLPQDQAVLLALVKPLRVSCTATALM